MATAFGQMRRGSRSIINNEKQWIIPLLLLSFSLDKNRVCVKIKNERLMIL